MSQDSEKNNSATDSLTFQRLGRMFGENCNDLKFSLPPECRDAGLPEWPLKRVEYDGDLWKQGCLWPEIPGEFDNMRNINIFARVLTGRLLHLVLFLLTTNLSFALFR